MSVPSDGPDGKARFGRTEPLQWWCDRWDEDTPAGLALVKIR